METRRHGAVAVAGMLAAVCALGGTAGAKPALRGPEGGKAAADVRVDYSAEIDGGPIGHVPSGCPAFTVERPRTTDGAVVRAVDFGLSERRTDNGAAIAAALAACRRMKAVRLELAPGTYKVYDPEGISLIGLEDFVFDGKGAVLVFCRESRIREDRQQYDISRDGGNFFIKDCRRIVIRNFKVDWDWERDPLADFARVVGRHVDQERDDASYFDLKLTDLERHPKYPAPVPVIIVGQMREDRSNIAGSGWQCEVGYAEGHFGSKNEWIAPNVLRVWPAVRMPDRPFVKVYEPKFTPARNRREVQAMPDGALVRILHYYYGQNGFNMESNEHLTMEDIDVWSCRGFAYQVLGTQHHWQMIRANVVLPAHLRDKRAITTTADANHILESRGFCRFEDCRWERHIDDMNNFHDRLTVAVKKGANRFEIVNARGNNFFRASPGEEIGLLNADYSPLAWRGRVVSVEGDELVMDREVPREAQECFQLYRSDYATDNIHFRRCDFTNGFGRNLLQSNNTTIEDCVFSRTTGTPLGIISEWTYTAWCEGRGVTNVVVRNCDFDSNYCWNGGNGLFKTEIFSGACVRRNCESFVKTKVNPAFPAPAPWRKAVSGILVEKCRFRNPVGFVWHALGGDDLFFYDNEIVIDREEDFLNPRPYRGSCYFEDRRGVHARGNRFRTTLPAYAGAGILFDAPKTR
ncbi:MAG: hypothetical protein ACI4RD_05995 [Kiritimatiellia bacterium]